MNLSRIIVIIIVIVLFNCVRLQLRAITIQELSAVILYIPKYLWTRLRRTIDVFVREITCTEHVCQITLDHCWINAYNTDTIDLEKSFFFSFNHDRHVDLLAFYPEAGGTRRIIPRPTFNAVLRNLAGRAATSAIAYYVIPVLYIYIFLICVDIKKNNNNKIRHEPYRPRLRRHCTWTLLVILILPFLEFTGNIIFCYKWNHNVCSYCSISAADVWKVAV